MLLSLRPPFSVCIFTIGCPIKAKRKKKHNIISSHTHGHRHEHTDTVCTPLCTKTQQDAWGPFPSPYSVMDSAVWCLFDFVLHSHSFSISVDTHTHTGRERESVSEPLTQTVEEGALKTHYMDDQYCTHLRSMNPPLHPQHTHTFHQRWQMTFVSLRCVTVVTIRLHSDMVQQGWHAHTHIPVHTFRWSGEGHEKRPQLNILE